LFSELTQKEIADWRAKKRKKEGIFPSQSPTGAGYNKPTKKFDNLSREVLKTAFEVGYLPGKL
jgi:hypothetical protein